MTTEELLKPRWKVIATFPDNINYEVGSILDRNWCKYVNGEDASEGIVWEISDFPHLFKQLEWWEDRNEEDIPKYVKNKDGIILDMTISMPLAKSMKLVESFLSKSLPATREEYETYLKTYCQ
jgi:hypothetical protein